MFLKSVLRRPVFWVTSASCHTSIPSSLSIFVGLEHRVIHNITATLQLDWPFLSRCDQINLDGSETMNDDITIWAPATCRSKNQLVFGQNKCLHRESNVVWRDTCKLTGYWGSAAEKTVPVYGQLCIFKLITVNVAVVQLSYVWWHYSAVLL